MAWLTEAEHLYWRDVYTGKYDKKPVQKPAPEPITFKDIEQLLEDVHRRTEPLVRGLTEAGERLTATPAVREFRALMNRPIGERSPLGKFMRGLGLHG